MRVRVGSRWPSRPARRPGPTANAAQIPVMRWYVCENLRCGSGGPARWPIAARDLVRGDDVADIGPVEYAVIAFPGNQFNGEIVPALHELVDAGLVRIIDLAFVGKDADGGVMAFEITDLDGDAQDALVAVGAEPSGLLNDEDVDAVGDALEPDSSAALIVWEDVWAAKLSHAVRAAGGRMVDFQRIPPEVVADAHRWALSRVTTNQEDQ